MAAEFVYCPIATGTCPNGQLHGTLGDGQGVHSALYALCTPTTSSHPNLSGFMVTLATSHILALQQTVLRKPL